MWLLNLFTLGVFFACNQYSLPPPPMLMLLMLLLLPSTAGAGSGRLIIMAQTQRVFKLPTGAGASETCVITVADQTVCHNDFFFCFQDRGVSRSSPALGFSLPTAVSPPLSCFLSLSQMDVAECRRRGCRVHTFSSLLLFIRITVASQEESARCLQVKEETLRCSLQKAELFILAYRG